MSHSHSPMIYTYFYAPFFLSAFFFVSGFTFNPKSSFRTFFLHKCKTLLVPYFCFGMINALLAFLADGDSLLYRLKGLILSEKGNDDLWFIMCLFVMQLIFYSVWKLHYIAIHIFEKELYADIITCVLSISYSAFGYAIAKSASFSVPFQVTTALIMIPFMTFGFVWRRHGLKEIDLKTVCILIVVYGTSVLLIKNDISIHRDNYRYFSLFIPEGLFGVYVFASLSRKIAGHRKLLTKVLGFIGANTLVYYAFQSKVIRALDIIVSHFELRISDYFLSPLYAVLCCLVLAVPAIIINNYFPFMLGKTKKR